MEIKRVDPSLAGRVVEVKIPNGSNAQLSALQAAADAYGRKGQGINNLANAMNRLGQAGQQFAMTQSAIEDGRQKERERQEAELKDRQEQADLQAQRQYEAELKERQKVELQNAQLATKTDTMAYSDAIGQAALNAKQEFGARTYGTLDEAQQAYAKIFWEKIGDVDKRFFPANEEDRVAGQYFRYAQALGFTADSEQLMQIKLSNFFSGAGDVRKQWDVEQGQINGNIINQKKENAVEGGITDPNYYYNLVDGMGLFTSKEAQKQWANDAANEAKVRIISKGRGAFLDSFQEVASNMLEAAISRNDGDFDKAQEEVANAMQEQGGLYMSKDDPFLKDFSSAKPENKKFVEHMNKTFEAELAKQQSEFKRSAHYNRMERLNESMSGSGVITLENAAFMSAYNAENRYGGAGINNARESLYVNGDIRGDTTDDLDVTEVVAGSLIVKAATLDFNDKDDVKTAVDILNKASELEPDLQQQVKDLIQARVKFAVKGNPEDKSSITERNRAVRVFMANTINGGIDLKLGDYSGDDLMLVGRLQKSIEGQPVSQFNNLLSAAYNKYKAEKVGLITADDIARDFVFKFADLDEIERKNKEVEEQVKEQERQEKRDETKRNSHRTLTPQELDNITQAVY